VPVRVYVGATGTGKTTRAVQDAVLSRLPTLYVDPIRAENFSGLVHLPPDRAAARVIGGQSALCSPTREELDAAVDSIMRARPGPRGILIDEAWDYMSVTTLSSTLREALRAHRHYALHFFIVTQLPKDLNPVVFACDPTAYVFRLRRHRDLERVELEWGFPRDVVAELGTGRYLVHNP
jgi:hypothetical protein